jgi:hypothetical protein
MLKAESGSDWRDGFLFVGNHPALDFLNTRPVLSGEEPTELLPDFAALLRRFRAANMLGSREASELWRRWGRIRTCETRSGFATSTAGEVPEGDPQI